MAIAMGSGFRVGDNSPIDDRIVYDTVASVFLPASQGGMVSARRHVGLKIYIVSEEKYYYFKTGTTQADFVEFTVEAEDSSLQFVDTVAELPASTSAEEDKLYVVRTPQSLYLWNGTTYEKFGADIWDAA
jgi:hypothetical protein